MSRSVKPKERKSSLLHSVNPTVDSDVQTLRRVQEESEADFSLTNDDVSALTTSQHPGLNTKTETDTLQYSMDSKVLPKNLLNVNAV